MPHKQPGEKKVKKRDKVVELNKIPPQVERSKKKRRRLRKRPEVERCPSREEDEIIQGEQGSDKELGLVKEVVKGPSKRRGRHGRILMRPVRKMQESGCPVQT